MSDLFTFIKHPLNMVLFQANEIVPGIKRMMGIYYDEGMDQLIAEQYDKSSGKKVESISIENCKDILLRLRAAKSKTEWLAMDEIPFNVDSQNPKENTNLFSETDNIVLLLRFMNLADRKFDLLYIFFNSNPSNFALIKNDTFLSTTNKKIIESILYSNINLLINQSWHNAAILKKLNNHTRNLIKQNTSIRESLILSREQYGNNLLSLCNDQLNAVALKNSKQYRFSDSAKKLIKTYSGDIDHLRPAINGAVSYLEMLYYGSAETSLVIEDWHLDLEESPKKTAGYVTHPDDKYHKTLVLLDKLEKAAMLVIAGDKKVTGTNIGKACPTPVTAPAISDALSKHRKKIIKLLQEQPERWKTLREHFRPIKNLMYLKNDYLSNSA